MVSDLFQIGFRLFQTGFKLVSDWFPNGFRMVFDSFPTGFKLISDWFPTGFRPVSDCAGFPLFPTIVSDRFTSSTAQGGGGSFRIGNL